MWPTLMAVLPEGQSVASLVDHVGNGLIGELFKGKSFKLDHPLSFGVVAHHVLSVRLSSVLLKGLFSNQSCRGRGSRTFEQRG